MSSPQLARGRHSQVDAAYAVTTVTAARRPWFRSAACAGRLVDALRASECEGATASLAWVVMPDHLHWLFVLRAGTLSACLQRLKSRSARTLRAHDGSAGALWQAGYYDHRLRGDDDLRVQSRYIVDNPVRKGWVRHWREYPHAWCRWDLP
ncbi:MAG TPA: transposase [Xanthomonadaceae bacterium]|jgi:REP element-mobilizing transposase RayT|nr:transposase [Xanthomonadaceae bacterium]